MAAENTNPLLIVVSAPSGGGKTTLCQQLLAATPNLTRAVTCTTRPPREGEQDGVDYYFLDAGSFLKRLQAGNFLEHATVYGHSYGTLKAEVFGKLRQGKDVLLNVDVQGAGRHPRTGRGGGRIEKSTGYDVFDAQLAGLAGKPAQEKGAPIRRRPCKNGLSVARQEIAQWKNFDYLLISTSIAEDLRRMQSIVEAEKMRPTRAQPPVVD